MSSASEGGVLTRGAFDAAAAHHAGFVRAFLPNLKPNAQPIGLYDALLAGHTPWRWARSS